MRNNILLKKKASKEIKKKAARREIRAQETLFITSVQSSLKKS
jgi:hypothetical protein